MTPEVIESRLLFLREAERLKSILRSAHSSTGRMESTAEHSWRLCLMAMLFEDALPGLDMLRVLKMCVVHDLGEAISGDVPATLQQVSSDKAAQERADLQQLTRMLDPAARAGILALWEEYESAATPEARAVKAMDKLETVLQHNQGKNPPGFDYRFNLDYGRKYTDAYPLFQAIRARLDADTRKRMQNN